MLKSLYTFFICACFSASVYFEKAASNPEMSSEAYTEYYDLSIWPPYERSQEKLYLETGSFDVRHVE